MIEIPRKRLDEAVGVLVAAFEDDPLMRYLFDGAQAPYLDCLTALHRFACLVRLELDWPLIGVEVDGALAGVLGVTMPEDDVWPDSLREIYSGFGLVAGETAVQRLEAYSDLADGGRPTEPHHHVGMIGVHPSYQGKGLGRSLIDAVQAMSEAHPTSTGVALDTENPASRAFYEHCGYCVTDEFDFNGITVWIMFRPNARGQ